jgi:hypothetical protein
MTFPYVSRLTGLLPALAGALALTAGTLPVAAEELAVPGDFSSIQAAIDDAESGDIIIVQPDTYRTNLTINKQIELRGAETARTLIQADDGDEAAVVVLNTGGVTLRNLSFNSGPAGVVITNSTNIDVVNNVFALGSGSTGIEITDSTSTGEISYNSFVGNGTAINTADDFLINNNLFESNDATLQSNLTLVDASRNCFDNGQTPFGDNTTEGDILFAARSLGDYHLREESACLNEAGDETNAGAYGGSLTDEVPFPPQGVAGSDASAGDPPVYAVSLEWDANLWHRTDGYRLYYGSSGSGEYEGTDAKDAGGSTVESPVDVGDVTEFTLHELDAPNDAPGTPELNEPLPGNEQLTLNWSEVDGASSYTVHYGLGSPDENSVDAGNTTTYTLEGLQNGSQYSVQVSAVSRARYFLSVSVVDDRGNESALSEEQAVGIGDPIEGARSNTVTGFPELVEPYPPLPDEGDSRCFIATAAYARADAPEVRALRAFRDAYLLNHPIGRRAVGWYYTHSPRLAEWLDAHPGVKPWVRGALAPAVWTANLLTDGRTAGTALLPGAAGLVLLYAGFRLRRRRPTNQGVRGA